jgi:hypothetical protein
MKKSILFGGLTPSPPRGGPGWGHLKNGICRLANVICLDVADFYKEKTLRQIISNPYQNTQ